MNAEEKDKQPDLLDKHLTMGWQDLLLPVFMSGSLMLLCFYIGHYQLSIFWIFILTGLYLLKTRVWIARQEARLQMRKQILRERGALGVMGATNKELPNWIRFPDSERVEWINQMLQQLWPYISQYSVNFMREFIEPQVLAQMPSPFKSFRFVDIDMGDTPCRVSGLKVYTQNVGRDKIIVDLDVAYAGDSEFKVKVCGFTGGMNEIALSGRLRCILQPLIPQPPMVAGISGSFVELPKFDFNLTGMGDFLQLPLLDNAIRSVINAQMANLCVLPNSMVVPLVPEVNITRLFVPLPDGVVRVKLVEAKNLENKDVSFLIKDRSDPYCELRLGSQLLKTRTINNNLDPKFDEYFEVVVDQLTAQKLRINVFDEDTTSADEELGNLSIPMTLVEKNKVISKWFNLESCKHGSLYLKLFWCQLSPVLSVTRPIPSMSEFKNTNRPVHSMLMVVFVDNVKDLPNSKSSVEPSPVLELTLGNAAQAMQRTPVKVKTNSPVYQSKFLFLIKESSDKDLQELAIKALDSNNEKTLGELSIPLSSIIELPDMEVFDKVYQMQHGVHTSFITLTIRIRHIIPPVGATTTEITDISSYANASYVERAEDTHIQKSNGDVVTLESNKRSEAHPQHRQEHQQQLNISRIASVQRRSSNLSSTSSKLTNKSLKSKFLRFRKPKNLNSELIEPGLLEYSLQFNESSVTLVFYVISVHNLTPSSSSGKISSYVSVKLFKDSAIGQNLKLKRRTNIIENATSPIFDNRFEFEIDPNEFHTYRLLVVVKDSHRGLMTKSANLGQVEISLANFKKSDSVRQKVSLELP